MPSSTREDLTVLPKHEVLREALRKEIQVGNFKSGDRFYGYSELIKKSGLSAPTVSRALSGLVKEGWLETVRGSGIYVRKSCEDLAVSAAGVRLGLVMPDWDLDYTPGYLYDIVHGVLAETDSNDWRVELIHSGGNGRKDISFVEKIQSRTSDGVIWVNPGTECLPNLVRLQERGVPIVCTSRSYPLQVPLPVVQEDVYQMIDLSVAEIVKHGDCRFCVIVPDGRDPWVHFIESAMQERAALNDLEMLVCRFPSDNDMQQDILRLFFEKNDDIRCCVVMWPHIIRNVEIALKECGRNFESEEMLYICRNPDRMHLGYANANIMELSWSMRDIGIQAVRLFKKLLSPSEDKSVPLIPVSIDRYKLEGHGPFIPN